MTKHIPMMAVTGLLALGTAAGIPGLLETKPALAQAAEEPVYGSQLMTQQERLQYRDRMRQAQSEQERQRIREEHHRQMQARAKERGVTLPDEPPMQGMHRGRGPGQGMGPGGMGSGGPGMGQGGTGPGGGRGN